MAFQFRMVLAVTTQQDVPVDEPDPFAETRRQAEELRRQYG